MSQATSGWYVARGGQQTGPVPYEQLQAMVGAGELHPGDLVWTDGQADWKPAGGLPGLFPPGVATVQMTPYASGVLNYNADTATGRYVGFWMRLLAYVLDYVVTYVAGMALGYGVARILLTALRGSTDPQSLILIIKGVAFVVGLVMGWLYFALLESSAAQGSLGKMALKMKVTDLNGNRISFGRATGRYFAKILSGLILCIGFLMIAWRPRKQGLHDEIAGTYVMKK